MIRDVLEWFMSVYYFNVEIACTRMHFVYGVTNRNTSLARHLYAEKYPNQRILSRTLFKVIHRHLYVYIEMEGRHIEHLL